MACRIGAHMSWSSSLMSTWFVLEQQRRAIHAIHFMSLVIQCRCGTGSNVEQLYNGTHPELCCSEGELLAAPGSRALQSAVADPSTFKFLSSDQKGGTGVSPVFSVAPADRRKTRPTVFTNKPKPLCHLGRPKLLRSDRSTGIIRAKSNGSRSLSCILHARPLRKNQSYKR